jgi:hypothetical protein
MTYVNAIYRDERVRFDNINHQDRLYQIYVSYVSAMVVLKYYPNAEEIKQVFTQEVQKLTGTTLQFIHTVDNSYERTNLRSRGIKRPLFDDIKHVVDMKFVDFNFFKEWMSIDPMNGLKRYADTPYADYRKMDVIINVRNSKVVVNTNIVHDMFANSRDVPA